VVVLVVVLVVEDLFPYGLLWKVEEGFII